MLENGNPKGLARRHFLAATSAAAAKIASIAAVAAMSPAASAHAFGVSKSKRRGSKPKRASASPQCFLRGTHILTDRGEVPVETLRIGDLVQTMDGSVAPVRWVGALNIEAEDGRSDTDSLPVRIARSAIADGVPHRDLYVSPWHFLYFDGHLIPARDLINGASIRQCAAGEMEDIEYFHVLLDRHAVLLAEGALAESLFVAANDAARDEPAMVPGELRASFDSAMASCAPRLWYAGGRSHVTALLRLGVSTFVDVRDPIQVVNHKLIARADRLAA